MATFTIFWSAVMAVVCFAISSLLKGILAIIMGIGSTIADLFYCLYFGGGAAFLLYLLASTVKAISEGTFWSAIGSIVLTIVLVTIIIGFVGGIGGIILTPVIGLANWALNIITEVFARVYCLFENGYAHFLKTIMIKLELIKPESANVSEN